MPAEFGPDAFIGYQLNGLNWTEAETPLLQTIPAFVSAGWSALVAQFGCHEFCEEWVRIGIWQIQN